MRNPILLLTKKRRRSFARRRVKKSSATYCIIPQSRCSAYGKKRSSSGLLGENVLDEHKKLDNSLFV